MTMLLAVGLESYTVFGLSLPIIVAVAAGVGIYIWYRSKGGDAANPLGPLTEDLDDLPTSTGRPTLDKVLQIAADHFKGSPALLYLIHKEAEELAFVLKPDEEEKEAKP